ncbi:MAG TPA: Mpo1-like protein [Candidatus Sulfotelmatobacter sp.]|nr:Mpo1-like protein [Candidatus Sulfotelmatobacter sp.]
MLGSYSSEEWVARYARSHQHPVNRLCHTFGIPTILVSLVVFLAGFFYHRLWIVAGILFIAGWILQFVGHAFEGKPPEFFHDWRFLFVGVRWWWAKINGRA